MTRQPHLALYHMPGACSRVTVNALEEIGLKYEDHPIGLLSGDQHGAAYRAINPLGKVPALLVDGQLLTENAAILLYLDQLSGFGKLLPRADGVFAAASQRSDIIWCSSSVHPVVTTIRMPIRYTDGDQAPIRAMGIAKLTPIARLVDTRVAGDQWWYGAQWSIIDVYLYWLFDTARSADFVLDEYPELARHLDRVRARPSFARAVAREKASAARGAVALPPGASLD